MRSASLKLFLAYIFIGFYSLVSAQNIPPKPDILYPVYDKVGLLTQQEKDALNNKLIKFADSSSTEIEVIILPNTGGEDVNYLAARYGEKWGIGQKGKDNGIVILIKPKTGREKGEVAISVGYGLEGVVPDVIASRIIRNEIIPAFQQNAYYKGIDKATSVLIDLSKGEYTADEYKNKDNGGAFDIVIGFIILLILVSLIFRRRGGNGGYTPGHRSGGGGFFIFPMGGGSSSGGFGGFSSGGGSFGGFGGGSFGGGGSSGSW